MFNEGKTEVAMDRGLEAILALKARGAVWDCDIELVTRSVLAGRPLTRAEADALFDVECANIEKCSAWTCFLVEAITDHLVWEARPTGIIDEEKAEWLLDHVDRAASLNGLAVLVNVLAEAHKVPLWLVSAARARAARGWPGVAEALNQATVAA
jgi:hypothetical protein